MAAVAEPSGPAEQKAKTRAYWDAFYAERAAGEDAPTSDDDDDDALEWIVPAAPAFLDAVAGLCPPPRGGATDGAPEAPERAVRVLEIGCGVSRLSRLLLQRLLRRDREAAPRLSRAYDFLATDVSAECLARNRLRDASFTASLPAAEGRLRYAPLDVLEHDVPASRRHRHDVVLDKGTLDTFLFRSKRTHRGSAAHPPLLAPLLNNVHRWLRGGCGAKYLLVSPRRRITAVRDFRGFASVRRTALDGGAGVLVQGNGEGTRPAAAYLYECVRDDAYDPDADAPYAEEGGAGAAAVCRRCGVTFAEFRGTADGRDPGEVAWQRRWKNHVIHCK